MRRKRPRAYMQGLYTLQRKQEAFPEAYKSGRLTPYSQTSLYDWCDPSAWHYTKRVPWFGKVLNLLPSKAIELLEPGKFNLSQSKPFACKQVPKLEASIA
jgi:hypothetical protein